ncbi:MAG: GNAT family N-acetyltransferase [Spirochaetaceae bacterium]|jgi:GNAT superfamily N-acetyltransferase|nr:GNAT family N-acetyltransferase [Spirochaetaceae bacterium]
MSDEIEIISVSTKKELKKFIMFPWDIYRGEKKYENWVPPLIIDQKDQFNREKNPFFKHADLQAFLAYKNGKLCGRIAAIIDYSYVEYQKDEVGFFGYFECFDDDAVAGALFKVAEEWVKSKGYKRITGPMNPTTGKSIGTLIDTFDIPPIIEMGYNAEYYPALIEKCGYGKSKDLLSYIMKTTLKLSDKMLRVAEIVKKRYNITIRSLDMKEWDKTIPLLRNIYNEAWAENWGFVPFNEEEFDHLAKDLKMIVNPDLVLIAYMGDEPVGFTIPLPDFNQIFIKMNGRLFPTGLIKLLTGKKKVDIIRTAILGVKKKAHNKGIDAVLIKEIYERCVKLGINGSELSWILEDNLALINLLEGWGAKHYRTYRIYDKKI